MKELVIQGKAITKNYGSFRALDSLDISIPKGSIYGLIGLNGAGKSTLLKILLGLIKYDHGEIRIFDSDKLDVKKLNKIGSIIEYPYFYEHLTGEENLCIHAEFLQFTDKNRIREIFDLVDLPSAEQKKVREYSLGMRQRLAIGRAILQKPDLLILDEPINALDPEGIKGMRELFKNINREYGTTILISSHILSEMEMMADYIGIISDKHMVKEMSMHELKEATKKHLIIETDDNRKAKKILENSGIRNVKIEEKNELKVYEEIDVTKAIRMLLDNDMRIKEIYENSCSLEDYFLDTVMRG